MTLADKCLRLAATRLMQFRAPVYQYKDEGFRCWYCDAPVNNDSSRHKKLCAWRELSAQVEKIMTCTP